jgi:NAD(P)-dependent dehydrogenase (short-subunit alcohol dehydrogenase family)
MHNVVVDREHQLRSQGDRSRIAVVSGGTAGLGQAIALQLAAAGMDIVVADVEEPQETAEGIRKIDRHCLSVVGDVSDSENVRTLGSRVQAFGGCDILINNAGIYPACAFEDLTLSMWRRVFAVIVESMFLLAQAFVPKMKHRGWGRIVNQSSHTVGPMAPGAAHYTTSKAAVIGLTRALASELGPHGTTVNAVAPGVTRTPGTTRYSTASLGDTEALFAQDRERQAIRRTAVSADVVGAVAFLASNAASFVTGQTLVVDSGFWRV